MQNNPQELSWQAIQAIVGVKLSVDVLRFDGIGLHLIKHAEPSVELDSDVEIVEDDSDCEPLADINGNARPAPSPQLLPGAEQDGSSDGADADENELRSKCDLKLVSKEEYTELAEGPLCDDNDNSVDNSLSIDDYLEVTLSTDSENGHACNQCDASFTSERELSCHTCIPKAKEEKKHGCHVCVEKFPSYWELRTHINTHFPGMLDSGKSSYCHLCQKDYTKTGFMNHLRKHTGERPFVCELCQKAFSQSSSLSIHMKFHLNVRKHACSVCEKKFVTKSELSRHMTVHTKQKSYYCGVCDKAFTRSDNMKKHEKTHG